MDDEFVEFTQAEVGWLIGIVQAHAACYAKMGLDVPKRALVVGEKLEQMLVPNEHA
jgi:hypothetical protein